MSLLDTANETVTVFLEEVSADRDGNRFTRPSETGIPARARIWPLDMVSAHTENHDGGFNTTAKYGLRFPRSWPHVLGAQSQIEWNGKRYVTEGDPKSFNGSRRTAHVDYVIVRR